MKEEADLDRELANSKDGKRLLELYLETLLTVVTASNCIAFRCS